MSSGMIKIDGWPIYYEKFGSGSEVILIIPGAIGTGRSDFLPQLEGPHALDQQKYTLIAIELPGWGRSRPPERGFDENVYENDADIALKLMDTLNYRSGYSVIGWSYGAKVALIMAMKNSQQIKCVVSMSVLMRVTREVLEPVLSTKDTYDWPKRFSDNYQPVYGGDQDIVQMLWGTHLEACEKLFSNGYWTEDLESIRSPVLVLHGDLDEICTLEHPLYVDEHVKNSVLYRFSSGGHNFHQKYPAEFKTVVENFIDNYNKV